MRDMRVLVGLEYVLCYAHMALKYSGDIQLCRSVQLQVRYVLSTIMARLYRKQLINAPKI